eukprot:TRINITY_DN5670_c0_g1_i2.p2 TRINITY_DN5670_c0_g1~~TRINITY_DN5670_c0_g1_i2.p2  ORF type:complete len:220 (-),score=-18.64 TRINITY_DN5670_c0_g1_i2:319-978(-)
MNLRLQLIRYIFTKLVVQYYFILVQKQIFQVKSINLHNPIHNNILFICNSIIISENSQKKSCMQPIKVQQYIQATTSCKQLVLLSIEPIFNVLYTTMVVFIQYLQRIAKILFYTKHYFHHQQHTYQTIFVVNIKRTQLKTKGYHKIIEIDQQTLILTFIKSEFALYISTTQTDHLVSDTKIQKFPQLVDCQQLQIHPDKTHYNCKLVSVQICQRMQTLK